ncbi:MAG TPA: BON domain-containing protein [Streptosporangiaceae bacterium]|nr:BON domain-containing protein [Streptosporangiaceae bacterium]
MYSIADVADLTVGSAGWGTAVLSGAVRSRSDHDLAIATAWSVADVQAVEDCIHVEADT